MTDRTRKRRFRRPPPIAEQEVLRLVGDLLAHVSDEKTDAYAELGSPFGRQWIGAVSWWNFETWTTTN